MQVNRRWKTKKEGVAFFFRFFLGLTLLWPLFGTSQ